VRLRDAHLLTDENIHPEVVRFLKGEGFDVLDVKIHALIGSTDLELVRRAFIEEQIIVTHDRDFGRLVFASQEPFWGIWYLRPGHLDPSCTIATLRAVIAQDLGPEPPFTLVAEQRQGQVKIRLRHLS
jgi:predicted nuclease of predicted toxin-antitoxin system